MRAAVLHFYFLAFPAFRYDAAIQENALAHLRARAL